MAFEQFVEKCFPQILAWAISLLNKLVAKLKRLEVAVESRLPIIDLLSTFMQVSKESKAELNIVKLQSWACSCFTEDLIEA